MRYHRQGAAAGRAAPDWRFFPLRFAAVLFLVLAGIPALAVAQTTLPDEAAEETETAKPPAPPAPPPPPKPPVCVPDIVVIKVSDNICSTQCQRFKRCNGAITGTPACVQGPC